MPGKNTDNTIALLRTHIEDLTNKIDSLIVEREKAERALDTILPKRARRLVYIKDSTLKQKALYCLKLKRKVLSTNEMLEILYEVDPELQDDSNTVKSLRLALFRLNNDDEIVTYKTSMMKTIRYGLKNWTDEKGQIKDEYL